MKVKITNNDSVDWWYHGKVGESFDVVKEFTGYYNVRINRTKLGNVFKTDCVLEDTKQGTRGVMSDGTDR